MTPRRQIGRRLELVRHIPEVTERAHRAAVEQSRRDRRALAWAGVVVLVVAALVGGSVVASWLSAE